MLSIYKHKAQEHSLRTELLIYVTGSEKRGNLQNVNFYHFSNCHHTKAFMALHFRPSTSQIQR